MKKAYTKHYFFAISIIVFILGIIAFLDNFFFDVHQESNSHPAFIIHGLSMYTWLIVLIVQTNRIRKLDVSGHKKFGITGFALGFLMIITTAYLYLFVVETPWADLPFFGKANRIFLPSFAIMFIWAYRLRNKPEWHKRLIFVGLFLILEPILSRVCGNLDLPTIPTAPSIWMFFWLSFLFYDYLSLKKLHPLTYLGPIYWLAIYSIVS